MGRSTSENPSTTLSVTAALKTKEAPETTTPGGQHHTQNEAFRGTNTLTHAHTKTTLIRTVGSLSRYRTDVFPLVRRLARSVLTKQRHTHREACSKKRTMRCPPASSQLSTRRRPNVVPAAGPQGVPATQPILPPRVSPSHSAGPHRAHVAPDRRPSTATAAPAAAGVSRCPWASSSSSSHSRWWSVEKRLVTAASASAATVDGAAAVGAVGHRTTGAGAATATAAAADPIGSCSRASRHRAVHARGPEKDE